MISDEKERKENEQLDRAREEEENNTMEENDKKEEKIQKLKNHQNDLGLPPPYSQTDSLLNKFDNSFINYTNGDTEILPEMEPRLIIRQGKGVLYNSYTSLKEQEQEQQKEQEQKKQQEKQQEKQQRAVSLPPPQPRRHNVGSNTHSKQFSYAPPLFPTPPPQQRISNISILQQQIQYPIQSSILQIFPSVNPPLPPNKADNDREKDKSTQLQVQQSDYSVDQWQIRVNWEDDGPNEDILRQEFAPFKTVNVILDLMELTDTKRSAIISFGSQEQALRAKEEMDGAVIQGCVLEVTLLPQKVDEQTEKQNKYK
ncbi:MAG: hypothetical protein EZS28_025316 [Streblomastix strix]|uniref:RRM domain-containing protein n=1 Tax=Streblomastix strix TaxID=222440 RepID=A0A5J4V9F7_9EUKA|nr:MAG: hypothetical protein EZS28_025316 [Streblomastix strix]